MLSYFDRFPGFLPNCRANIENEFHRLAMLKNWKEGKAEWKKQWNTCCKVELNAAFAGDEGGNTKLQGWQDLCYEVGIRPAPPSITQCKKVQCCQHKLFGTEAKCESAGSQKSSRQSSRTNERAPQCTAATALQELRRAYEVDVCKERSPIPTGTSEGGRIRSRPIEEIQIGRRPLPRDTPESRWRMLFQRLGALYQTATELCTAGKVQQQHWDKLSSYRSR